MTENTRRQEIQMENSQKRITDLFRDVQNEIHSKNNTNKDATNGITETENEEDSLSPQEMIVDARQRRTVKTNLFNCDMCKFTTGSMTIIKQNKSNNHKANCQENENKIMEIEMRKRLKCDKCDFKSTSADIIK